MRNTAAAYLGRTLSGKEIYFRNKEGRRAEGGGIVIGPPRSGKDACFVIPHILRVSGCSLILADIKGEYCAVTARWLKKIGMRVYLIGELPAFFRHRPNVEQVCVNILRTIDPKHPDFGFVCDARAADLIPRKEGDQNAWVYDLARMFGSGIIMALKLFFSPAEQNLVTFYELANSPKIFQFAKDMHLKGNPLLSARLARLATRHANESREISSALSTLANYTNFIGNEATMKFLDPRRGLREIDWLSFRQYPSACFVVPPMTDLANAAPFLRALTSNSLKDLMKNPVGLPVEWIINEFGQIPLIEAVEQNMSWTAGLNISIAPILQDYLQLHQIYGDRAGSFLSVAAWKALLPPREKTTKELVSEIAGMQEVLSQSRSYRHPTEWSDTLHQTARRVLTPDEAQDLPEDKLILKIENVPNIILAQRLPYFKDRALRGRWDPDPYHGRF